MVGGQKLSGIGKSGTEAHVCILFFEYFQFDRLDTFALICLNCGYRIGFPLFAIRIRRFVMQNLNKSWKYK